jgi:hypothetical protein
MRMKVQGQLRRIKNLWLILVFSVTVFLLAGAEIHGTLLSASG